MVRYDPAALELRLRGLERQNRALKVLMGAFAAFFAWFLWVIYSPDRGPVAFVDRGVSRPVKFGLPPVTSGRDAQQHYLSGVVYYQKGMYKEARDEWKLALRRDPKMEDARAGLERIAQLYGGGAP